MTSGLLPLCFFNRFQAPCIRYIRRDEQGNVEEVLTAPAGDPKFW